MVGVQQVASAAAHASEAHRQQQTPAGVNPFASVMRSMMSETSALESMAQTAVQGLLDGSGVELHEAMIATQKADMAFELALQVRNKAVAAYQQMMTMQF